MKIGRLLIHIFFIEKWRKIDLSVFSGKLDSGSGKNLGLAREMYPQNFSLISSAVLEEMGFKHTYYCFRIVKNHLICLLFRSKN